MGAKLNLKCSFVEGFFLGVMSGCTVYEWQNLVCIEWVILYDYLKF